MTNEEPVVLETVSEELLPCPFCGGDGHVGRVGNRMEVICQTCGSAGALAVDRTLAIAAWNRRSPVLASRLAIQAPATLDEWGEEDGDVVWWCWRNGEWLGESPYIGSPLDLGQTVEIELRTNQGEFVHRHDVGGWPGYHTHWTPRPALPAAPNLGATK